MADSMIQSMRDYIASCPLMSMFDSKNRHIDWTDADNENYGIFPDGDILKQSYIDGSEVRQYTCQITIRRFSKFDADRLKNNEFMEQLQEWFDTQLEEDNLPELPAGCSVSEISAANAILSELGITGKTGVYTIQIIMEYIKD